MSAARWPFRVLSATAVAQADALAHCRQAGIEPVWQPRPVAGALLRFSIVTPALRLNVLVAADSWWPSHWPGLPGIAWSELTAPDMLQHFMPTAALLDLHDPQLQDAEVTLLGLAPSAECTASTTAPSPALATAQGVAWIEQAQCLQPAAQAQAARPHVTVLLDLHIAQLQLPVRRLRRLAPGSILLLKGLRPTLRIGRTSLCAIDFTLETFTVTDTFDFFSDDAGLPSPTAARATPSRSEAEPTAEAMPQGLDVSRLPLTLEVVLCRLPQTVAALTALQPGAVFALPAESWKSVQLQVNGQCIASGELVQVGDQLGVQLHHAPDLS